MDIYGRFLQFRNLKWPATSVPASQPFLQGLHRLWRAYLASPAAGESADGRRECPVLARGAAGAAAHPPGPVG